jgi:hypothetical protein
LKENEKVVSENDSKINSKAVAKGKAPINAAHNKRDLAASKKHNEKLDPIANRKIAKAAPVSNAKGNGNRSLVQNPNDVQGEPLRGKIRPLSSSTLALSRVANSTGAGAAPAGGAVLRGGSRAKSGLFGKKRALDPKPQSSGAEGRGERLARRNSAQDLLKANAHHAVDPNAPSQVSAAALARSRAAAADDAHPLEI